VKLGAGVSEYEYRILQLLDRLGTLPSPHPIHFFTLDECKEIVMSTMPGRVRAIGHGMSSEDRVRLLREVQAYMTRTNHAMAVCRETVRTLTSGAISDLDGLRCLKFPLLDGFLWTRCPQTHLRSQAWFNCKSQSFTS